MASEFEAIARALSAIDGDEVRTPETEAPDCCGGDFRTALRAVRRWARGGPHEDLDVVFEDQTGERVSYDAFFRGAPSIVAFFYTRCENPEKCSLTVTKLGRVVRLLAERGLTTRIRTAGISYDPAWDVPERLLGYARNRGVPCDAHHRLLRAVHGDSELRDRFGLGVNFVESLVNRHRVELFLLDAEGRIHTSFERLQWDELGVVEQAMELLDVGADGPPPAVSGPRRGATKRAVPVGSAGARVRRVAHALPGPLLAVATAFFPKCPACWAAYLSVFGIVGLDALPYSPWLLPLFAVLMLMNLVSVGRRSAASGNSVPFWLSALGASVILVLGLVLGLRWAASVGVALSLLGSLASALRWQRRSATQNAPSTPMLGTVTGPIASSSQVP